MNLNVSIPWLLEQKNGCLIRFWIQPNASKCEVIGPHGDSGRLKVKIAAPPVDGAANEELVHFLKTKLKLPKAQIEVIRGQTSRQKDVFCQGLTSDQIISALKN